MIFNADGSGISVDWAAPQPTADRPFWTSGTYEDNGQRVLHLDVPITHFAEHYHTHPDVAKYAHGNSWRRVRVAGGVTLHHHDDYKNWMVGFQFPQEIRLSAERAAAHLVRSVELRTRKTVERDRLSGRFDFRKINRIEREVARGTYVHEQVRPYKRIEKVDSMLPTVAIVGAMHTSTMTTQYTSTLITLVLALRWACEIAGLPVVAAAAQGAQFGVARYYGGTRYGQSDFVRQQYGDCHSIVQMFVLSTPNYQPPWKVYSIFMHSELWMHLKVHLKGTHPDYANHIAGFEGYDYTQSRHLYDCFATSTGGRAVSWARNVAKADIVIACGRITDAEDADLFFPATINLDDAIAQLQHVLESAS